MAEGAWIRVNAVDAHLDARTVNDIIETALKKRTESITQRPALRKSIGELYLEEVTPFVPKKSGQLRKSGYATDDGRVYWTAIGDGVSYDYNYASKVYDEDGDMWPGGEYNNPTTDFTYPRWTEKVRPDTDKWNNFTRNVADRIKEEFRND